MFRILLIIAIIYFVIKLFFRYILPLVVNKAVNKAQEKMQKQAEEMFRQNDRRAEGEISIKQKPGLKNKKKNDDDEYVDYEEIK